MLFILIVCAASVADLVHATVEYRCLLSGSAEGSRLCGAAEPAYTVVTPRCRPLHYSPTSLGYMECLDGNWNYVAKCVPGLDSSITCRLDCGRVTPLGTKLVVGGKPVKRGELPWHAGIYQKISNPPMQICGGSLISKDVVLSAAHCFWSEKEKQLPASQFAVAVGKLANFQDDVAVVIVAQEFHFQNHIRPVCLNFDYHFEAQQLYAGNKGKVAGWGLTAANGNASSVLKVVDMPFVEVGTCIASAPPDFYEYITSDKICAGTLESDVAVCKGDSGGGLAFSESIRGIARYYLRGIVSTAPNNENACNTDTYTSFTSIMKHEYFIKQGEFRCRDGSYITAANYCDGTKDCADGSDETTSACSGKTCSSYLFQCDYGACVDTGATCNGVCHHISNAPLSHNNRQMQATPSVTFLGAKPGEGYERVTITNVECEFGYGVLGSTAERFYCFNGVWTDILPKCVRMCELERHPSVEYRCLDSDDDEGSRACGLLEHNGTVVSPRCQQPNYYTMTPLALMRCVDGEWDYIAKCTPG
ncbi:Hemolymph protein 14 [Operophtera brumata]|uniref:Hemolymph protein 14 n=1 Tax=Operophtera brumata TaxID=104452 RepID=A0A0L7LAL3_OPEBR|nr:Hemolymph protein 14 [Operophtera brumata]